MITVRQIFLPSTLLSLSVISNGISLTSQILSLGPLIVFLFLVASIFFVWLSFGITLSKKTFSRRLSHHVVIVLILFFYTLVISIPNMSAGIFDGDLRVPVVRGLLQWSIFPIGIVLMTLSVLELYRLLNVMMVTVILLVFLTLIFGDYAALQVNSDDYRRVVFGSMDNKSAYNIHLTASLFIIGLGFIYSALGKLKKGKIIFLLGIIISLFTAMYYGKRATITDLSIALILWYFAELRLSDKFSMVGIFRMVLGIVIAASIVLFVINLIFHDALFSFFDQLITRFYNTNSSATVGSDRLYELEVYWNSLSLLQKISGAGLAYIYQGPIYDFWHGTHIGWSNLHILGGFPLLIYGMYLALTASTGYPIKLKNSEGKYYFSGLALLITISLSHSTIIGDITGWIVAFALFGTRLPIFAREK